MFTRSIRLASVVFVLGIGSALCFAQPAPSIPPGFQGPGPWPNTVCGALLIIRNVAVPQEPDQAGEDNLFFEVPASGPFHWTSSRNNGGDFGLNISPFFGPADAQSYPPQPANNFIGTNDGTTYAWRLSFATGVALTTPRSNGTFSRFVYNGEPITLHYTASFGNGSTAHGYSMNTGLHTTQGGAGEMGVDLLLGCAGIPDRQEAVGDAAVAYFPFEQGWIGGHWDHVNGGWEQGVASSPGLPTSVVSQIGSKFRVDLPGVDSATDGMLFANSTQTNSNLKTIGVYPNNGGWTVFMREDDDIDTSGLTPPPDDGINFSFLYVPWDSPGLIGGHIRGTTGAVLHSAGEFTFTRHWEGWYTLSIPGKSDQDGALILIGAGRKSATSDLPDRKFLSYEPEFGGFFIGAHELIADNNTPWGRTPIAHDSDFYFMWVDFTDPLAPPNACVACDANCDGSINLFDIVPFVDQLSDQTPGCSPCAADANNDGSLNLFDIVPFVECLGG